MVDSETISKKVATNVTSALAGNSPGVQIVTPSGDPASNNPTIRIRGSGSMYASSNPLIVLDGVPYSGRMSDINPNDVESMSVLKDAAASAIYGHRGANGVIIITTKKSKSSDAKVTFDARVGVNSRLIPQYDVMTDPKQYYETYYKMLYNTQIYAGKSEEEAYAFADANLFNKDNGGLGYQVYTVPDGQFFIGRNFKMNPNATLGYYDGEYYYQPDDWYNEAFHNSVRQEYNASISGSSDRFNYYASVGYLNDGGVVANSRYQRYTARLNAEYQVKEWLRAITNMSFAHSDTETAAYSSTYGSSGNIFYIVNNIGPIYPLYVRKLDENGNPYIVEEAGRKLFDSNNTNQKRPNIVGNAVRDNLYDSRKGYIDDFTGKWGLIFNPFEGFNITANLGVTSYNRRSNNLYSIFGSDPGHDGSTSVNHDRVFTVNQQYMANYKHEFANMMHLEALVGYEQYSIKEQNLYGYNERLYSPYIGELNNADATKPKKAESNTTGYLSQGFFGRVQWDDNETIFLSASYRRDASSRFAKGHRWGNFGSVGAAWVISKEPFLAEAKAVDMLKFKISYGVQGNDNLNSYFPYADNYKHSYNEETGTYSIVLNYKGNENLTWETTREFNVGADFEVFGGYLGGSIEWYTRNTTDLLFYKDVPVSSGNPTGQIPVNVGSINNKGFDLDLYGNIIKTKNVHWQWNANLSHYKNTITDLDEDVKEEGLKYSNAIYEIGGSLYDAYMRKYAGVNPENGKALYYYEAPVKDDDGNPVLDANGDPLYKTDITDNFDKSSQYRLGSILPKVFGGFGTSINAYGIDFSCQFSYQLGGRYYDGTYQSLMHTQRSAGSAWHKDVLRHWTPENPNTDVPRLEDVAVESQTATDRFLISSNYLSINNVTLGYTLPAKFTRKFFVESLRIYVAGENLAVFSARKGVDPRYNLGLGSYTSGSGLNSGNYSAMRTITGGITLTF